MDFEQDNLGVPGQEPPRQYSQPPQQPAYIQPPLMEKPKRRSGWKIFWAIVTVLSILANGLLLIMLLGVIAVFAAGQRELFVEEIIQPGPRTTKIAVIALDGIIDEQRAKDVAEQLKTAEDDDHVKGLILRVSSPGGTISGSDDIYNEIRKYRSRTGRPVVAFMQGIAASGGYYASVACDKIIAEPTTITGSIGVIMGYFVFQELLEGKLGIQPIIVKSGRRKDWPSPFQMPTDEQRQYLQDRLITPAYERFVQIVAEGRRSLTPEDVNRLADGSIYSADKALDEKLIDNIGYMDDAIKIVSEMAKIEKAQVVEYRKPFSLAGLLSARSNAVLKIDRTTLYEMTTPQVLYLWTMY